MLFINFILSEEKKMCVLLFEKLAQSCPSN